MASMTKFKVQVVPTWNWLPDPRYMVIRRNKNYFRSLVAGCLSPLFHLPQMIWALFVRPLIVGIASIFTIVVVNFVAGILGFSSGVDIRIVDDKNEEVVFYKS